MQYLYSFTPLVVAILILLIKKYDFKKIVNGVFLGIVVLIFVFILDAITNSIFNMSTTLYKTNIILGILAGALPEELSKFIVMKLSKQKSKYNIFVYMMLIALTFAGIENFLFFNDAGLFSGITRVLSPGHLVFGFVMSFFLVKANGSKISGLYNTLALIAPVIVHQLFNTLNDTYEIAVYVIGVIAYILLIIKLFRIKDEEGKIKLFIPKLIFVILVLLFFNRVGKFNPVPFNTSAEIYNGVTMKVLEVTEVDKTFSKETNVKVEIDNQSSELYKISTFDFTGLNQKDGDLMSVYNISDFEVEASSKKEIIVTVNRKDDQKCAYIRYKKTLKSVKENAETIIFELK